MKGFNKVFFNTFILYVQLILGMIIGLLSTRIVLKNLGENNYGIYILVAGVIGVLGILNSNMSNTSMRFMAHSLGSDDLQKSLKTFNTTLLIHLILGVLASLFMEIGGWLMFEYVLNIPLEKVFEAKIVYHLMVITTFVMVISVPYDAIINAHENILFLSIVDVIGYCLKLIAAIVIYYFQNNVLIIYGLLIFLVEVSLRLLKQLYTKKYYNECRVDFNQYVDKSLLKSILSFTGWNLFGSLGAMVVTQLRSLLLNSFFGVKINASDGIANNASNQVNLIASNITKALNPQLVKSEGAGERSKMILITEVGTKYSTFLFALFALPIIFEVPFLLQIWLKSVPDYTAIFIQILLLNMLIEKFTFQITEAIRAVGKIRNFQVTETFLRILNFPLAYFTFKFGYPPYSIYLIGVLISCVVFFNRLYFGKIVLGFNVFDYLKNAVIPILIPILLSSTVLFVSYFYFEEGLLRLFIMTVLYIAIFLISFWEIGMKKEERIRFNELLLTLVSKIYK
jgi:O-antigen/teichoic acid export membrane protein